MIRIRKRVISLFLIVIVMSLGFNISVIHGAEEETIIPEEIPIETGEPITEEMQANTRIIPMQTAEASPYYLTSNGLTWVYRDSYIDVGVGYTTNDTSPEFRWEYYNIATGQWFVISDWSTSNWASWKTDKGSYWLHCKMRTSDGLNYKEETIGFEYVAGNTKIAGQSVFFDENNNVTLGAVGQGSDSLMFMYKIYNVQTGEWYNVTDNKVPNNSWASWIPPAYGSYWAHFELYTADGRLADTYTYGFEVVDTALQNTKITGQSVIFDENNNVLLNAMGEGPGSISFMYKIYNVQTGEWYNVTSSNVSSNTWASWTPSSYGSYWAHFELYTADGRLADTYTYGFEVMDPSQNTIGQRIAQMALTQVGKPYTWGGVGPNSYDCSGLVYWAYNQAGVRLGRTTAAGYSQSGRSIPLSEAKAGDVVTFFNLGYVSHMGIFIDDQGTIVHAIGLKNEINGQWGGSVRVNNVNDLGMVIQNVRRLY